MKLIAQVLTVGAIAISSPAALAQNAVGDWHGTLNAGGTTLRLAVHIADGKDGEMIGTLDSLDQGAVAIPLANITSDNGELAFDVPTIRGRYEGKWDESSALWKGTWSQGPSQLPLDLAEGAAPPPQALPADWQIPSDDELRQLIDSRIAPRPGAGVIIGVIESGGQRIVADGPAGSATFNGNTIFEIGSISKVFTALILSDMVLKGEVSLDDPVQKFLPAGSKVPERAGKQITLRDLSQHRSGLPRLPDNMPFGDPDDPYADYSEQLLLEFLAGYELPRDIRGQWDYSNLGVGLLGYALTQASGKDYEALLKERITGPLGMDDTVVMLSADQRTRFAQGYDAFMRPAKPWHLPALVGAGGIRSSTGDMLKFAAAVLNSDSPIAPAVQMALSQTSAGPDAKTEQVLGWQIYHPEPDRDIVMHNGGTGGYRSMLMFELAKGRSVIVLTNSAAEPATNDLALHALVGAPVAATPPVPPAPPPPVARTAVELPAAELDRVVGRYDFGQGVLFDVVRDGEGLKAQRADVAGAPNLPIFPEAPLRFFWKASDTQIVFMADENGEVTGAEFTAAGQSLTGKKVNP